ncbi:MAG: hypothetical protein A4E65_03030 [Syntrophorhabdus sp. PtaU1.Bin153]|nr:MAG: hypothetical protein A4E65_03030 [Syntrophorhabdus sp. PtaU1.Bin153]
MFTRQPNKKEELKTIAASIAEREGKLSQLRTSLKEAREELVTISRAISAAETEREDILDRYIAGQATQTDLDKVRKHFDVLVTKEVDLKDIIKTTEAVISRTENEILPLQRQKSDIERLIWIAASEEIKYELRANMKSVLQGVAVQKMLGSPVHSRMIADLFFNNGLPTPEEIRSGEAEVIKRYLG